MFSRTDLMAQPLSALAAWQLQMQCDRCRRAGAIWLRPYVPRPPREATLGDILPRVRCKKCGARPSLVMVSNARRLGDRVGWFNTETKKGPLQVVLWAPRNT